MLNQPPKLSKKERKRLKEEYKEIQKNLKFELWDNDLSVSSLDYVNFIIKYKTKD
jgi:hypothetical protein